MTSVTTIPNEVLLGSLRLGQRFRLLFHEVGSARVQCGTLIDTSTCSARVALDASEGDRTFVAHDDDGNEHEVSMRFGPKLTYWSPLALVEPLDEIVDLTKREKSHTPSAPGSSKRAEPLPETLSWQVIPEKLTAHHRVKLFSNPAVKNHDAIVLQAIQALIFHSSPATTSSVAAWAEASGRYATNDAISKSVLYHLRKLEREGLVKGLA
jgi:hypothetical protein